MQILAVNGSLRPGSTNHGILETVRRRFPAGHTLDIFRGMPEIPPFDGSGTESAPEAVVAFRSALAAADALLISTPEYAHSIPGVLKNALDWVVGSGELALKPIAIISASTAVTAGLRAQCALVQTLLAQSAEIVALLPIGRTKEKVNDDGQIVHVGTLRLLDEIVNALLERCAERSIHDGHFSG
jgi:chromate reductase